MVIKYYFCLYLMNVSGQIMLNATYMHNQMTYLWQGPQITVYKCIFFILQFSDKRGTKLSDSERQQIHLSCVLGVIPPVFSLGHGDGVFSLHWWLQQLEACSSSQHLEPFCWHCWTLQTFPFWSLTCFLCNKPLVGGLKTSEIQFYTRNPYRIAEFNLYEERRTGQRLAI